MVQDEICDFPNGDLVNQFEETPNQLSAIAMSANSVGNNEIHGSVNMDLESKLNWNLEGNRNQGQMDLVSGEDKTTVNLIVEDDSMESDGGRSSQEDITIPNSKDSLGIQDGLGLVTNDIIPTINHHRQSGSIATMAPVGITLAHDHDCFPI
ncbi:hypothetical protein L1887_03621 [Cichorium endivia]|nr:hypothetical protein L1887_03621 [Cichorium endivia]